MTAKWIVGLDLGRTGDGALGFAKWLAGDGGALGVHVLEEDHLLYVLRDHHLDEVVKGASDALRGRVAAAGLASAFADLRVVQGIQVDDALEEVRAAAGGAGVIVGRAAPEGGLHLVRLGRVARRLLRTLASPVIVVPPELGGGAGPGPIIALTNLHEDSAGGCRFAAETAARLGRKWIALHVARGLEVDYLPATSRERAQGAKRAAARDALDAWLAGLGLRPDAALAEEGSAVAKACEIAVRERSPLLVTGSRRLTAPERALQTSFGSALAAAAPVAVAVVPPSG